jgi:hypothetical protein
MDSMNLWGICPPWSLWLEVSIEKWVSDAKMDDLGLLPLETTRLWYIITMNSWNMKKHP